MYVLLIDIPNEPPRCLAAESLKTVAQALYDFVAANWEWEFHESAANLRNYTPEEAIRFFLDSSHNAAILLFTSEGADPYFQQIDPYDLPYAELQLALPSSVFEKELRL